MTTAQKIAALLNNDGACYDADDGRTLDQIARDEGAYTEKRDHLLRYVFDDGSAIVDADAACWDIEGSEPFSMAAA